MHPISAIQVQQNLPYFSLCLFFLFNFLRTKFKLKINFFVFLVRPTPRLPLVPLLLSTSPSTAATLHLLPPPPPLSVSSLHPTSTVVSSLFLGGRDKLRPPVAVADLADQGKRWQRCASTELAGEASGGDPSSAHAALAGRVQLELSSCSCLDVWRGERGGQSSGMRDGEA